MALASHIEIDIANNAELRANAHRVLSLTRAGRPKNTSMAYGPKQREFQVSEQQGYISTCVAIWLIGSSPPLDS
jgi:hypothetical protein